MIAKTFEVRDTATFIPMLAVQLNPTNEADRHLLARSGYGEVPEGQGEFVMLWSLNGGQAGYDPYAWGNRTRQVAHRYICDNFDSLESGAVIDVQYILGETEAPKISEADPSLWTL